MAAYATFEDVEKRLNTSFPDEADQTAITSAIEEASAYIDAECRQAGVDPNTIDDGLLKIVTVDLVASWWQTLEVPAGASSVSKTVGDVSMSVSYGSAAAAATRSPWFLSRQQRRLLGLQRPAFFTIQMVPDVPFGRCGR